MLTELQGYVSYFKSVSSNVAMIGSPIASLAKFATGNMIEQREEMALLTLSDAQILPDASAFKAWKDALPTTTNEEILLYLNCSRIEAVEQAEDGGDDEEGLDAEDIPDPATEEGNEDGDEVIDRNAGRDGGTHLLLTIGDVLHIDVRGHGGQ